MTLHETGGGPRISLTSDRVGPVNDAENAIALGVRDDAGQLNMARMRSQPQERENTVELDAEMARVSLGSSNQAGRIDLTGGSKGPQSAIVLNGAEATITVGGSPGIEPGHTIREKAGRIVLVDATNTETVTIEGKADDESGGSMIAMSSSSGGVSIRSKGGSGGGKIQLMTSQDVAAATLDGGTGTLVLGQSSIVNVSADVLPETASPPDPVNGELWLDDGRGKKLGLKAESGMVGLGASSDSSGKIGLVLNPEEGVFSLVDGTGNTVFEIDTQNETVRTAYSREDM